MSNDDAVIEVPLPKDEPLVAEINEARLERGLGPLRHTIHLVKPTQGDIVIITFRDTIPQEQMKQMQKGLREYADLHFKNTGVFFAFILMNERVDIQQLTARDRVEMLHAQGLTLNDDASVCTTIQAITDMEEG